MTPHINTSQPSSQLLACALVVSCLAATVQANSSSGTDAPGTNPASGPTTAYNEAGASGNNGGLSKLAQIVIGVVIGVIGLGTSKLPSKKFIRHMPSLVRPLQHGLITTLLYSRRCHCILLSKEEEVGREDQAL